MAGTTGKGYPYPQPNDPINAYPALGQQLANAIDAHDHPNRAPAAHGHSVGEVGGLDSSLRHRPAWLTGDAVQVFGTATSVAVQVQSNAIGTVNFPAGGFASACVGVVITPIYTPSNRVTQRTIFTLGGVRRDGFDFWAADADSGLWAGGPWPADLYYLAFGY